MNLLVVAPHPDDEVLGVGGVIARMVSEGADAYVIILTKGYPPHFDERSVNETREEAKSAHQLLGVKETIFLDYPAAALDSAPHRDLNHDLHQAMKKIRPDTLYIPFNGDIHLDHQIAFLSCLVAARPVSEHAPKSIYAYETLSETNWNASYLTPGFQPNVYMDISGHLDAKLEACKCYGSQIKPFPNERSLEAVKYLAHLRGCTVGLSAAEAFVLIRSVQ